MRGIQEMQTASASEPPPARHAAAGPLPRRLRSVRRSMIAALLLVVWDALFMGNSLTSLVLCPIWCLVSVVVNLFAQPR